MGSAVIGALRVNLSADTAEFQRNLTDAERIAQRFGTVVGSEIRKHLLALGAAAAAAAGPTALGLLVKSSFETISAQVDLARRVGASVAAIQTLEQAAKLSGGSAEDLAAALGRLNVSLGQAAREGAGPAYEALQRLGLSAQALSNMDADKRIEALSDRMKELGYNTQQQADTLKALGIKQQDLINLFQQGSAAIERSRDDLKDWGVLLSDIDAAKVEEANNAWERISVVLEGVGNQIAIRVAPFVEALADGIGDAAKQTHGFGDVIDQVINTAILLFAQLDREVYDFRTSTDEAIGTLIDGYNQISLIPRFGLSMLFPDAKELEPIENKFGHLRETLALPPSDAQWIVWKNNLIKTANEAAAAAASAGKPGGTGTGNNGPTEAEIAAQEKLQQQLAARLDVVRQSLMTETEAENESYQERLSSLEAFYGMGRISQQEYTNDVVRAYAIHADKLKKIDDEVARNEKRNADLRRAAIFSIAGDIASSLEAVFGKSKLVAIAQAVINTAQAVTTNLAAYPGGWGLAAAAVAAAAGAVQIGIIANTTTSGGGGGGRGSSVASSVPSSSASQPAQPAPAVPTQTFFISGLAPGQLFTSDAVRGLMSQMIDLQRDGVKLVLAPT
jgi:hypothetical protein